MSDSLPPPPSSPPPSGPPPVGPPPEYLASPAASGGSGRGGRRTALAAGGAVLGVALLAGGGWALWSFLATGPQPAEALPDSTLAYAAIDLDPSGGQKIEALRTLKKFPAFEDEVGLDTDDDIREWVFDQFVDATGCDDLDYGDDVEPWLGDRFAVAAVDTGADQPTPIFVVQVGDADAADAGMAEIRECAGTAEDDGAWTITGDWMLLGETQDVVDGVAADAAKAPLADDGDFQHWTDEAGSTGIASFYAAPALGEWAAGQLDDLSSGLTGLGSDFGMPEEYSDETDLEPIVPTEVLDGLKDFPGAAATVRFDDGGLELEVASGPTSRLPLDEIDEGGKAAESLPESTVAALGLGFYDGWAQDLLDQMMAEDDGSLDQMIDDVEQATGLSLPADLETVAGDALAVAVSPDVDLGDLAGSDVSGVGVKVLGDADEIDGVLDKVRAAADGADDGFLDSDAGDGAVAVGPDADYRATLLADDGLGRSDSFQRVVEHADEAAAVLYLDFDGGDDWLAQLAEGDDEVRDNLDPLDALGMSVWFDDDTTHAVLKVTTD